MDPYAPPAAPVATKEAASLPASAHVAGVVALLGNALLLFIMLDVPDRRANLDDIVISSFYLLVAVTSSLTIMLRGRVRWLFIGAVGLNVLVIVRFAYMALNSDASWVPENIGMLLFPVIGLLNLVAAISVRRAPAM